MTGNTPYARGAVWMVISCLTFALVWAMIREANAQVPVLMIIFIRTLVGLIAFAPDFYRHGFGLYRTAHLKAHIARGGSSIVAMYGIFFAVTMIPLANAVAISYSAPLLVTLGAVLFLGESFRWRRWLALAVGFLGMILVVRPGVDTLTPGVLLALIGSVATAVSLLIIKKASGRDSPATITVWSFTLLLPVTALTAALNWTSLSLEGWLLAGTVGLLANIGQRTLALAFANAEASALMPLDFTRLVFAGVLGYLWFGEVADQWTITGAVIILGASVFIGLREARLKGVQP